MHSLILFCYLTFYCAASLKINIQDIDDLNSDFKLHERMNEDELTLTNVSEWTATVKPKHYLSGKKEIYDGTEKAKTILFYGCSIDRRAIEGICPKKQLTANIAKGEVKCNIPGFELISLVNPGSGERPYWFEDALEKRKVPVKLPRSEYLQTYIKNYMQKQATASPDLVVVDSSLWDVAKWVRFPDGKTQEQHVEKWCRQDIPNLLQSVQETFPSSRVVFVTQPRVTSRAKDKFANGVHTLTAMYQCITSELHGKTDIIDYHGILEDKLQDSTEQVMFMKDGYHPAEPVAKEYLNEVMNYAETMK